MAYLYLEEIKILSFPLKTVRQLLPNLKKGIFKLQLSKNIVMV
jgi:hypothetical protein